MAIIVRYCLTNSSKCLPLLNLMKYITLVVVMDIVFMCSIFSYG